MIDRPGNLSMEGQGFSASFAFTIRRRDQFSIGILDRDALRLGIAERHWRSTMVVAVVVVWALGEPPRTVPFGTMSQSSFEPRALS